METPIQEIDLDEILVYYVNSEILYPTSLAYKALLARSLGTWKSLYWDEECKDPPLYILVSKRIQFLGGLVLYHKKKGINLPRTISVQ